MSRVVPILLVVLALTPATGQPPEVAPPPRPATKPVAPSPRPFEPDLTKEDPGLDRNIEAAIPEVIVPGIPGLDDPKNPPKAGEVPVLLAGRTGRLREKLVKEFGGNEASEKAVAAGLAWLVRQQKADGSWEYDGEKGEVTAATGMALLALLGSGETHTGNGKYAKSVKAGVNWLVRNLPVAGRNAGKFDKSSTMYAQGIGTLALVEAYALSKDKALLPPAQAAINYIQRQQGVNGSWGYSVTTPESGDTSILGWQVQAIYAASLTKDIVVDERIVKKAVQFLDLVAAGSRKEKYGYATNAGAAPGTSLTAVGLLSRSSIDKWASNTPGMIDGVTGLMARAPGGTTAKPAAKKPALEMYFYYYATQVALRFGGDEWKDWNEGPQVAGKRAGGMRDWLVELQVAKEGANQGSWDPDSGFIGKMCGRVGTTSLCVLTLEAYYRYPMAIRKKELDPELRKLIESVKGG